MKMRGMSLVAFALVCSSFVFAQQPAGPPPDQGAQGSQGAEPGGRGWGRGLGMGNGVMGTVTGVAGDHFDVKNMAGETWTIHYSVNTWIMKQRSQPDAATGQQRPTGGYGRQPIKATDIKVGDAILAGGEVDQSAKSVGAIGVILLDPDRASQMRELQAEYGKTWLAGRVTAINDTTITLQGNMDSDSHTFVADENTRFRRHREPITLADLQVGDNLRVAGAIKDGQFVAATVVVMMPQATGGPVKRPGPPPQ